MKKIMTKSKHHFLYTSADKLSIFNSIFTAILCALLPCITACIPHQQASTHRVQTTQAVSNSDGAPALLRADPGYIQWLTQQSFLYTAKELIEVVSGTNVAWHHDGTHINSKPLLNKSSMWLELRPKDITQTDGIASISKLLSLPSTAASLQEKGLALYLSDIQDVDSIWTINTTNTDNIPQNTFTKNISTAPISYEIDSSVGTEQDILALAQSLRQSYPNRRGTSRPQLLGTDIIPASTALGPDFFLAARGHKDYIGAFVMIEVPQRDWGLLPSVHDEWQCQVLTAPQLESLQQKGLIPRKIYSDTSKVEQTTDKKSQQSIPAKNWAVTGAIRGVDGNVRRWVYACADSAMHPILHWNDPSKRAHRIFSASIIKNTGLLGMPLVGLSLQDLCGLEVQTNPTIGTSSTKEHAKLLTMLKENEPMLTAAQSLAHEIRSYGGWSWLRQALPTALLPHFMQSAYHDSTGPDFFTSQVGNAMKEALKQGQARPLHDCFDELLHYNIDSTRLVHTLPAIKQSPQDGILATTFLATQSGLIMYPAQSILSLTSQIYEDANSGILQNITTIQDLQKAILAFPDYSSWRDYYKITMSKLIKRLPSSKSSLILLSTLQSKETQYLVTITNVTEHTAHEKLLLNEDPSHNTPRIQEINTKNIQLSSNKMLSIQGNTHFIEFEIPAKTCRIFIISSL